MVYGENILSTSSVRREFTSPWKSAMKVVGIRYWKSEYVDIDDFEIGSADKLKITCEVFRYPHIWKRKLFISMI